MSPAAQAGPDGPTRRWIHHEQSVNERLLHPRLTPCDDRSNTVRQPYRPERSGVWRQQAIWLPRAAARAYGPVAADLAEAFGQAVPADRLPLFVHPQPPAAHRRLAAAYGRERFGDVLVTPTASARSVLAWSPGRAPAVLKLSLGAIIGHTRRTLREVQIARAVLMTRVFDSVREGHRAELGIDWFTETSGVADTASGSGWLLRRLPRQPSQDRWLMPAFSFIAARGDEPPLLVDLIRRTGQSPQVYLLETLLVRYVEAIAYLLFVHGIRTEGHVQNVLLEVGADDVPTGRIVLRDLSDTVVSVPLRIARRKLLPPLPVDVPGGACRLGLAINAMDAKAKAWRPIGSRAAFTVESYGLRGFLWPFNQVLSRHFPGYDSAVMERTYFELWQAQADRFLGVIPDFTDGGGIATDEALAHYLRLQDWRRHGATNGHALPDAARPLREGEGARRRSGPVYERVESEWGDVFLHRGRPAFFRPAF